MLFAVAYLFEEFPRYDSAKSDGKVVRFYYKDVEVYSFDYSQCGQFVDIKFAHILRVDFIETESAADALKKIIEKVPFHILMTAVLAVPEVSKNE